MELGLYSSQSTPPGNVLICVKLPTQLTKNVNRGTITDRSQEFHVGALTLVY